MRLRTLMLMTAMLGAGVPALPEHLMPREREPPEPPGGPLTVACPRCKAQPGAECKGQLGKHRFHMARVKAAQQVRDTTPAEADGWDIFTCA